jgi:hypothetical protein
VGKKQKSKGNPFADKIPAPTTPDITVTLEKTQHQISVNLKYYHAKSQCLSQWQRDELKKLSRFFAKVQALTLDIIFPERPDLWGAKAESW